MVLPIVRYDNEVLHKKGAPVVAFDTALAELARDMVETMHEAAGSGLAAPQIGRAMQFFVMDLHGTQSDFSWELDGRHQPLDLIMPMSIANPKLTAVPAGKRISEEGCLSFPGIHGDVERAFAVRMEFDDVHGQRHSLLCDGLLARCVQHETDHVNGILFTERMSKEVLGTIDAELKAMRRETRNARKRLADEPGLL
ncbi:MAG TPA: peptide deformylase [Opitutaceae bacterium]|nr:peptide deformylase [Opitutaceae bacterium]